MTCLVATLIAWLTLHPKITFGIGYFFMAGVSTMPHPGAPFTWLTLYTWFYDWLQAVLPQKFHSSLPFPPPVPKELPPATPKV